MNESNPLMLEAFVRGDRNDAWRFNTRENNKRWLDGVPVAQVIKEKIELVHKYPGASDGIFAVY